jgi:hypothetical protein
MELDSMKGQFVVVQTAALSSTHGAAAQLSVAPEWAWVNLSGPLVNVISRESVGMQDLARCARGQWLASVHHGPHVRTVAVAACSGMS